MSRNWDVPDIEDALPDLPGPGLKRRRILRAAGINLHVVDFTEQEQDERGFHRSVAAKVDITPVP